MILTTLINLVLIFRLPIIDITCPVYLISSVILTVVYDELHEYCVLTDF